MKMKQLVKSLRGVVVIGVANGVLLASSAQAALMISDINGTATDALYVYTEGAAADTLGIPGRGVGGVFWEITTLSANELFFRTIADVGGASAVVDLVGLEANDDWISASITGTSGVPFLSYAGGDTANLSFPGGGSWFIGDTITITFEAAAASVPEPVTAALLGLGLAGLAFSRRRT